MHLEPIGRKNDSSPDAVAKGKLFFPLWNRTSSSEIDQKCSLGGNLGCYRTGLEVALEGNKYVVSANSAGVVSHHRLAADESLGFSTTDLDALVANETSVSRIEFHRLKPEQKFEDERN